MSEFFDPYNADRPLMLKCSCGRDHSPADHHAEVAADAAAATLRARSETAEFEAYSQEFIEATLVKALFPQDQERRNFLRAVGKKTAMAAIAIQPKMLLLDEPFGALDALTRGTIQDELMGIVRQTQQTVFMITHDVDEAILLSDRILLMSNGNEVNGRYVPGGLAEVVQNPLPRDRTRAQLHHLPGYYELRNHIVDFLVSRAKAH